VLRREVKLLDVAKLRAFAGRTATVQ
jgi:hypothetical protein